MLDPTLLLSALGAAVIGRMERLPTITCAAIGLGIVSQAARFHYSSEAYRSVVIAAIIAFALLVQRSTSLSRLTSAATSTWQETREVRADPGRAHATNPRCGSPAGCSACCSWSAIALVPVLLPGNRVELVDGRSRIYSLIGLSLVVLTGWAGQVSLGQMAFVGVRLRARRARWPRAGTSTPASCSSRAGALGALLAVVVGMPTLRARGPRVRGDHARVRARDLRLLPEHGLLADPELAARRA